MFAAGGIHYALGAIFSLWDPPWVPRPHFFTTEIGEDVGPSLRIGKAEFIWSQADNVAVLKMNLGGMVWKTAGPLPVVLLIPKGQKVSGDW